MIEVRSLTKIYGTRYALRGVSFEAKPAALLGIFGPNGAGKTTLVRLIAGQARPTAGTVLVAGQDIRRSPAEARRRIGVVGHHTFVYDDLTGFENLRFYSRMFGLRRSASQIRALLAEVGLEGRGDEPVRHYSRGMQQRLALARATLHDPQVLLLDEPYTGLDREASQFLDQLLQKQKESGRTVLLITHDVDHGLRLADDVLVLVQGRVVASGRATQFTAEAVQLLYEAERKRA